jgi:putative SOS response-associated peptidase YedK
MCGRFGASFQYRNVKVVWNLYGDFTGFFPHYNIAQSQDVQVIVRNEACNELRPMRWGLMLRGKRMLECGESTTGCR